MSKQSIPILTLTRTASGVLAANRFVTIAGALSGAAADALGVCRTAAAVGDYVPLDMIGTAVVETGAAVTAGVEVQSDATGRAIPSAGGVVLGVALDGASASGQFIEVYLRQQLGTQFSADYAANIVTTVSANGALPTSGIVLVAGGTGYALVTLAAPTPGSLLRIREISRTSGDVVITTAAGVTFDGTNNTATFNAVADELLLGYVSATQWVVIENISVTLSSV